MWNNEPIKLRFAYTRQDWVGAYRLHYSQTRRNFTDKIWALATATFAYFSLSWRYNPQTGFVFNSLLDLWFPLFFFVAAIIFWFNLAPLFGIWRMFNKKPKPPRKEYEFTFDDSGGRFQLDDEIDVKLGWGGFKRLLENKDTFVLITKQDPNSYWAIPKQYFSNAEELDKFRYLVNNKLFETPNPKN